MPTKPRLLIGNTRRLSDGRLLTAAIENQGSDVARDLAKRRTEAILDVLGNGTNGEPSPSPADGLAAEEETTSLPGPDFQERYNQAVENAIEIIGDDLGFAMSAIESISLTLYTLRSQAVELRQARDDRARQIELAIAALRGNFQNLFPSIPPHRFGFVDEKPVTAFDTLRRSRRIVDQFERLGDQLLSEPTSSRVDIPGLVEDLERDQRLLGETLDALDDLKRQEDTALVERNRTRAHLDRILLHGARIFESFCRLAGEDELADRVRPSIPRGGNVVLAGDDGEPSGNPDDQPSDDEPADPGSEPDGEADDEPADNR